MISKQKLLQFINDKIEVYGEPYDADESDDDKQMYKGALMMLALLERHICWGNLDADKLQECPTCSHDVDECFCVVDNGEEVEG